MLPSSGPSFLTAPTPTPLFLSLSLYKTTKFTYSTPLKTFFQKSWGGLLYYALLRIAILNGLYPRLLDSVPR